MFGLRNAYGLLGLVAGAALAAPPAGVQAEIEQLLDRLRASGCQFMRNEQWYDAAAAAKHLTGKLEAMVKREMITTTESFIERGASGSSMSGQPYQVRCAAALPIPSGEWLRAELLRQRQAKSKQ